MRSLIMMVILLLVSLSALAAIDVYDFSDPQQSVRFKKLTEELRCPKCQNQNLAGSNSALSVDLKGIVYEKVLVGETDQQILSFMKQRYGEFILYKPEMKQSNFLLWFGPIIFLFAFLFLFYRWYLKNKHVLEPRDDSLGSSADDDHEMEGSE